MLPFLNMRFYNRSNYHALQPFIEKMKNNQLTIENILEEDDIVQDLKTNQNSQFLYMISNEAIRKLIDYATKLPESDDQKIGHKYPFNAAELLSCDNNGIMERIMNEIKYAEEESDEEEKEDDEKGEKENEAKKEKNEGGEGAELVKNKDEENIAAGEGKEGEKKEVEEKEEVPAKENEGEAKEDKKEKGEKVEEEVKKELTQEQEKKEVNEAELKDEKKEEKIETEEKKEEKGETKEEAKEKLRLKNLKQSKGKLRLKNL